MLLKNKFNKKWFKTDYFTVYLFAHCMISAEYLVFLSFISGLEIPENKSIIVRYVNLL